MPRLAASRWEYVRRLYEESEMTVAEIAVFADVCESSIYQHVRRHGWVSWRRPGVSPRRAKRRFVPPTPALQALCGTDARSADGAAGDSAGLSVEHTAGLLWKALEKQLDDIEQFGLPKGERGTETLATMTRTMEMLIDVERAAEARRKGRVGK